MIIRSVRNLRFIHPSRSEEREGDDERERVEKKKRKKEMVTLIVGFGIKYFMWNAITFYQERKLAIIGFSHVILFVAFVVANLNSM